MDNLWAPVVGFPGYWVSNLGCVRGPKGVLEPLPDHGNYLRVGLYRERRGFKRSIHSLVMGAFGPPAPSPAHNIAHKDGDQSNNRFINLAWKTRIENEADKREHGTYRCGEQINTAKLTTEQVVQIRAIATPNITALAKQFGVTYHSMRDLVKRNTWKHASPNLPNTPDRRGE